jgi:hypothetical protein
MTKQFKANSPLAVPDVRNGFEIAEALSGTVALLYGLWLTFPTPDSARLLAVDANIASFLVIGSGQLVGMLQRRYSLRRAMSLLALLIWVFTAFYSFEPARLVFAAIAGWAFLRINRSEESSTQTSNAGRQSPGLAPIREYVLNDIYQ